MTKTQIIDLKNKGFGRDAVYQVAAGTLNLFGVAFFGYKGSKADKARLNRTWKRICNEFKN